MEPLAHLAEAITGYLGTVDDGAQSALAAIEHLRRSVLAATVRQTFRASAPPPHYATLLAASIRSAKEARTGAIGAALAALPEPLPWFYHYAPRPGTDLAAKIGFAELIGPDGPMQAPQCRVGFTLVAADTLYPMHSHPAVELYLVIAGQAQWCTPESQRVVPEGDFVLHPSGQPHAMQTFAEPLLALYSWSGDLETPAVYN